MDRPIFTNSPTFVFLKKNGTLSGRLKKTAAPDFEHTSPSKSLGKEIVKLHRLHEGSWPFQLFAYNQTLRYFPFQVIVLAVFHLKMLYWQNMTSPVFQIKVSAEFVLKQFSEVSGLDGYSDSLHNTIVPEPELQKDCILLHLSIFTARP